MKNEYNYHKYASWCKIRGLDGNLPDYLQMFMDETLYNATDIRIMTGLSNETIRRWFRNGNLKNQSASYAYKAYGKDIKQLLFNRPRVITPLKVNEQYKAFFKSGNIQ
jgi:hypothetical protein